jgi:hypothetical protein
MSNIKICVNGSSEQAPVMFPFIKKTLPWMRSQVDGESSTNGIVLFKFAMDN